MIIQRDRLHIKPIQLIKLWKRDQTLVWKWAFGRTRLWIYISIYIYIFKVVVDEIVQEIKIKKKKKIEKGFHFCEILYILNINRFGCYII